MTYRRESRYTKSVTVALEPAMLSSLETAAESWKLPVSGVVRMCVEAGLPKLRERMRSRKRFSKRPNKTDAGAAA